MSGKVIKFAPYKLRSQAEHEVLAESEISNKEEPIMPRLFSESVAPSRRDVWEAFLNDQELLDRYRVTEQEIDTLKTLAPFGTLTCSDDIIYILERIRRSRRRW
jgi:hypothetical protein